MVGDLHPCLLRPLGMGIRQVNYYSNHAEGFILFLRQRVKFELPVSGLQMGSETFFSVFTVTPECLLSWFVEKVCKRAFINMVGPCGGSFLVGGFLKFRARQQRMPAHSGRP